MTQSKRNYGIDLLRLVAMFMVVVLHVSGHGGILENVKGGGYEAAWLVDLAAFCAVDCYAVISGYVSYPEQEKKYRYSRYLSIWIPAFIYGFGINVAGAFLLKNTISIKWLIKSAAIVTKDYYWYVTAYTGVFFMEPVLNKAVRAASERELNTMMLMVLVVFCVYGNISGFQLNGGYSFVWLLILYLVGAWMKKNKIARKLSPLVWCVLLAGSVLFVWGWLNWGPFKQDHFVRYTSVFVVTAAVSLIAIFSEMKFRSEKICKGIEFWAPAAFGVYLIHDHGLIREHYISNAFVWVAELPVWKIPLAVLGCAFCIFAVCLLIERVRLTLFDKLKLNYLIGTVQRWIDDRIDACAEKI